MILKTTLTLFACFIVIHLQAQYNTNVQRSVCLHILNGQADSAKYYVKRLAPSPNTTALQNVIAGKASYANVLEFIVTANISSKQELIQQNKLIATQVKTPVNKERVDIDYVKIRWHQIQDMLNEEMIDDAEKITTDLKNYINKFPNKKDADVIRATIYASTYDIILSLIQQNLDKLKQLTLDNKTKAIAIKDTALLIASEYYYAECLLATNDLDGYIALCEASLALESKLTKKTYFYEPTIEHLIDASIYKGKFNETYIEELLHNIYTATNSEYYSYSLYAKFLGALPQNSPTQQRVFKQLGVANLQAFCDTVAKKAQGKINSRELFILYSECAKALFTHKLYKEAFRYKDKAIVTNKKTYSQELAQTIANSQTREVEQTKALENAQLQATINRQKIIVLIISIAILIVSVLLWFLYKTIQQRNATNLQLNSANKNLERLNVLNQKIFTLISHDFKTPMLTLSMLVNGIKKKSPDATILTHIAEVNNQLDNANAVLNNLLNWSKTEINIANATTHQTCNISTIATEITTQLQPLAQNKNIAFVCNIPQDAMVQLPADILRIVLRNLLSNAIKFSNKNSVIQLVFNTTLTTLQIIDTGVGMPLQKANMLFTTDVVSAFGTQQEPGFGMGLYLVHELLHKHHCTIAVSSQLQQGSTFTVTMPSTVAR
ncbi:MAG: HAMP domain-containing sensor histidine kinase [Bacteroidia bacterium]